MIDGCNSMLLRHVRLGHGLFYKGSEINYYPSLLHELMNKLFVSKYVTLFSFVWKRFF